MGAEWIESEGLVFEEVANMLHQTGYYLKERTQYTAAEPLYVRALAIY